MNTSYYNRLIEMSYDELCLFLQEKYTIPPADYFVNNNCVTKNNKINTRTKEGLVIHHIYENMACDLGNPINAVQYPFDYQRKENLLYCNYLEHLILHFKIILEHNYSDIEKDEHNCGLFILGCGAFEHIVPEINDYFGGSIDYPGWKLNCLNLIANDFKNYIIILKWFYPKYVNLGLNLISEDKMFLGVKEQDGIVENVKREYYK